MSGQECHEQYPAATVIASAFQSLVMYGIGAFVLYQFGLGWVIAYILFIVVLEVRLFSGHCVDCYYYGKACAFGKGRLSSLVFPKGNPEQFNRMTITWKDILPDFLVFILPVLAGSILMITRFSLLIVMCINALFILGFLGNAIVRGQLAYKYCKQNEIGFLRHNCLIRKARNPVYPAR